MVSFIKVNQEILISSIFNDLQDIMASYQIPKKIILIDEFPLNNSGKICKRTLGNTIHKKDYTRK